MPRNSTTHDRIQARVDEFVADLTKLIQQAALDAVHTALGESGPAPAPVRRKKAAGGRPARKKKGGKRIRRTRDDLDRMAKGIVAHVAANPGTGMSDLVKTFGAPPPTIRGPLNELIAAGKLRKEGERRGTKYFAGGQKSSKKSSKKAGKKRSSKK